MTNRLKDKFYLIIEATNEIGKAMTKLFANEGWKVIFTGRCEEKGKALKEVKILEIIKYYSKLTLQALKIMENL